MKKRIERLRGMRDLLPELYQQQRQIIERLQGFLSQAGYAPVDVPILERSDLFLSSFRQELWQNLYTFRLHNRDHCLRPEYTASICRLYLDQYQKQPLPLRLQYAGPVFRYETPGRSRYRQHTQLGIELFGGQPIFADAEILQLACDALGTIGISEYRLELGHIGVASSFIQRLRLDEQATHLLLGLMEQVSRSEEGEQKARTRLEAFYPEALDTQDQPGSEPTNNDARLLSSLLSGISVAFANDGERQEMIERFTWKIGRNEQRRQILYALDFLRELHAVAGSPPEVFERLRALLERYELTPQPLLELEQLVAIIEQSGVPRTCISLNLALGRGVSYYTGLVFEIHGRDEANSFEAQICGGGRYDQLLQKIGGPQDIRACGFAFGVDRLQDLLIPRVEKESRRILVIPVSQQDLPYALQIAREVRVARGEAELDVSGHGVSAGLRLAAKQSIPLAAIVGENERHMNTIMLHNLVSGVERQVPRARFMQNFAEKEW
ncbi:MAG TPA: ATP phosphoribosyltransferase regulatory subunit [Ktedonobacteraceae bacterium]